MKKTVVVLAASILTVFLTLFFYLSPSQIILMLNTMQQAVVLSAGQSDGNIVAGYRFSNVSLAGKDGMRLLVLDEVMLDIHPLQLMFGRIGIDIHSKEISAALSAGLDGSLKGQASFTGLPFDTEVFIPSSNVSFMAPVSGRVILSGKMADVEIRADEIAWKRLSVAGFELPQNMFVKGKGAITVEKSRTIVKSLAFEGDRGYARLSGEIISSQRRLTLELFPKDWSDLMLTPLERYKISPGQYNIPLNL